MVSEFSLPGLVTPWQLWMSVLVGAPSDHILYWWLGPAAGIFILHHTHATTLQQELSCAQQVHGSDERMRQICPSWVTWVRRRYVCIRTSRSGASLRHIQLGVGEGVLRSTFVHPWSELLPKYEDSTLPGWHVSCRMCEWLIWPSCLQRQRTERISVPFSRQRHTCCEHCPPLRIDLH